MTFTPSSQRSAMQTALAGARQTFGETWQHRPRTSDRTASTPAWGEPVDLPGAQASNPQTADLVQVSTQLRLTEILVLRVAIDAALSADDMVISPDGDEYLALGRLSRGPGGHRWLIGSEAGTVDLADTADGEVLR